MITSRHPFTHYTTGKDVRLLPDNEDRGYGRSYATDPKGTWWLTWIDDCFDPPVYAFREGTPEDAYDLAAGTLCSQPWPEDVDHLEEDELADRYHYVDGSGYVDTDHLQLIEWAPNTKQATNQ